MKAFDKTQQLELVNEANRAPSVHNTQPARWRFVSADEILLFEDTRRRLPIADPAGHDNRISLGAALEGLHLALSKRGLGLEQPEVVNRSSPESFEVPYLNLVARTALRPAAGMDQLAACVFKRRTFRRDFEAADNRSMEGLQWLCTSLADIVPLFDRGEIAQIGALHDRCSYEFLKRQDYHAELYHWVRLSETHPSWNRDGLNADCLGLSPFERPGASILFRPRVFTVLKAFRAASLLTSEARRTKSASAIAIFITSKQEDPLLTGRRFYRIWLEMCQAGFSLCPMSALADSAQGSEHLRRRYGIPEGSRVVNVFRVGKASEKTVKLSPRLPAEELLV